MPQTITITGVATDGINGTLIYCGIVNGKPAWGTDGVLITGTGNPYYTLVSWGTDGDVWRVARKSIYSAINLFAAATPAGLTGWIVTTGSGQPVITASATPTGTVIGQLCRSSSGLWRWDGSVWVEVTATASSIPRAAVLAALLSDPLPITSGGTGGDTPGAARTALGVGSEQAVQFGQISTTAQPLRIPLVYSNSSDFITTSTSFQNVAGLSFPVLANKQYQVMYWLVTNKNDSNGMQIQFTGPASPTKILIRHLGSSGNVTTTSVDIITAFSSPPSIFNNYSGDGFAFSSAAALLSNGANAGTVQLQLRAVTGGTAKIYAGSWIQVTQLN